MHQSGHSRAHSMHTVQFSSSNAITPRLRGGRSGLTSGYCRVTERRVSARNVTPRPRTSPDPIMGSSWPAGPVLTTLRAAQMPTCRPQAGAALTWLVVPLQGVHATGRHN